jgi:glucose/arabinose dehydrogenase
MSGCAKNAQLSPQASYGPKPVIPAPSKYIIPQNNTAPSAQWQGGETPVAPQGLTVKAFAKNLDHPRWLYVLPNGDVLVAESNHGT